MPPHPRHFIPKNRRNRQPGETVFRNATDSSHQKQAATTQKIAIAAGITPQSKRFFFKINYKLHLPPPKEGKAPLRETRVRCPNFATTALFPISADRRRNLFSHMRNPLGQRKRLPQRRTVCNKRARLKWRKQVPILYSVRVPSTRHQCCFP